jgi:hypothetical protein
MLTCWSTEVRSSIFCLLQNCVSTGYDNSYFVCEMFLICGSYITFTFCKVYNDLGSFAGHIIVYSHGECEDVPHRLPLPCSSQSLKWLATISKAKLRIPGTVMIFSKPTFVPTPGLDISSPRHEMKGRVPIYAVANNTPTKRARSVRPNAVFSWSL